MKRWVLGIGLATVAAAAAGGAGTASNTVPNSTAGYTSVRTTGATLRDISYVVAANTITGFTANLRGSQILKTGTASFNGGSAVACVMGVYDLVTDQTPLTCSGLAQQADRSWKLQITLS